ncbi:MAG: CehA/McbA family metallohydrolase [Chloroflexi bacterium]|nr:CehA/McbA family metallohydrolase [Chloroflexota bacterium]
MIELVVNLHIHTKYSDGSDTHLNIAKTAHEAGLDVLIFTDHNVLVRGIEPYFENNNRKLLILIGQEVHDPTRDPQKSHLLIFGGDKDLAPYGRNPQKVIDQANLTGALSFLAHPFENSLPQFHQTDITWEDWQVEGYTGIELWNGFSEIKDVIHNYLDGLFYTLFPEYIATAPPRVSLAKWDELLASGMRVVGIAGSDSHSLDFRLGFIHRKVLPYSYHFRSVNTHILVPDPLSGDVIMDRRMVIQAFRQGNAFVGYDLPSSTRGFRFIAQGKEITAQMGEEISLQSGITLQIHLPIKTRCILYRNGQRFKSWSNREVISQFIDQPGIYRVECFIQFLGKWRGWIYSNPIYVR